MFLVGIALLFFCVCGWDRAGNVEMIETRPDLPRQIYEQHSTARTTSSLTGSRSNESSTMTSIDHPSNSRHSAPASGSGGSAPSAHCSRPPTSASSSSLLGQTSTTSRGLQRIGEDWTTCGLIWSMKLHLSVDNVDLGKSIVSATEVSWLSANVQHKTCFIFANKIG